MTNEALKLSHVAATSPTDQDDPSFDGKIGAALCAQAIVALCQKLDILTAKLNADVGVTDTNYAEDFQSVISALKLS